MHKSSSHDILSSVGDVEYGPFIWGDLKNRINIRRHRLSFKTACRVFLDPNRVNSFDSAHSQKEERFFCIGKVKGRVATVRFTYRGDKIRIIGAGFWRKGKRTYEKKNAPR